MLIPAHDLEFMSVLNDIYDNIRVFSERRRGNNLHKEIINPQLNILAGTQPGFLGSLLPEEAWTMGFTSRLVPIYAATSPYVSIFKAQEPRVDLEKSLVAMLQRIYRCFGELVWHPDARRSSGRVD